MSDPTVQLSEDDNIYHGSMVLNNHSTDVLDVGKLLGKVLQKGSNLKLIEKEEAAETKVLLVEDSMFFRNLTIPFLTEVGLKVTEAVDGVDALKIFKQHDFDVIVTDIDMPNMNGFELAQEIRAGKKHNDIPIYAFTGTNNDDFQRQATECGMNGFIMKTERDKLVETISAIKQKKTMEFV